MAPGAYPPRTSAARGDPGVRAGSSVLAGDHGGGAWTQANPLRAGQGVRLLLDDPWSELLGGGVGGSDGQPQVARARFRRRRHQCPERALRGVLAASDGRESERKLAATGSRSKWPESGANQGRRTGHEAVSTGIPQNAYLGACSADREPEGRLAFSGQVSHGMGYPLRPEGTRHGLDPGGLLSQVRYGSSPRSPPDSRCSGFCRHLLVSCDWNLNTRNGPGRPVRIEAPPRGALRNLVVSARAGSAAGAPLQVAADPAV